MITHSSGDFIVKNICNHRLEIILSFLQACFVITQSSGDFIVKNISNHRLYTLQICKIGVVVNFNALFNCYAVKLSVAV